MKSKTESNKRFAKKAAKVAKKAAPKRAAKKAVAKKAVAPKKAAAKKAIAPKKAAKKAVAKKAIASKKAAKKARPKKAARKYAAKKAAMKEYAIRRRATVRKTAAEAALISIKSTVVEITEKKGNKMKKSLDEHMKILQEDYKKSLEDFANGKFKAFTAEEMIAFISEKSA